MATLSPSHLLAHLTLPNLFPLQMFYRDTRQFALVRPLYHPDPSQTRIRTSWLDGSIDEWIVGQTRITSNPDMTSSHLIQHIKTDLSPDSTKAVLTSVGNVSIRMLVEGVEIDVVSWCRFLNRAALVDVGDGRKEWRLLSFDAIYDRDSVVATDGTALPKGLVEVPEGARKSYKYVEWVLSRQRLSIRRDLAGTDDSESVERIVGEADAWLRHDQ